MKSTDSWVKYETGLNYFRREKYLAECAKAERFYANQHWWGMEDLDLPKPVLPLSKRIVDFKVSSVMAEDITMNFSVEGYAKAPEQPQDDMMQQDPMQMQPQQQDISPMASQYDEATTMFNGYSETTWEELKQKALNEEMLLNAALTGIGVEHYIFDKNSKYGNDDGVMAQAIGRIKGEVIDGTNLFLGNPNDRRINASGEPIQPYIIISYRELVSKCKEDAEANGISKEDIKLITSDNDIVDQSFDKAKIELDDQSKTTVLLHYFVKDKKIWYKKSCKNVDILKETNTELNIYPIVTMNWDIRKRSAYGMGEMKGQIPNQIAINQLMAQAILSAQRTGTPKFIYDKSRMSVPSNRLGQAIGVDGDITNAAKYLETGHVSNDMYNLIDKLVTLTKDLAGASENALGEAKADNTSAMMWAEKQSGIPLQSVRRRYYQSQEDVGLVWADIWKVKFNTTRAVTIKNKDGVQEVKNFNGSSYKDINMNLKIDIGASSQFSEITNLNMLNMWLDKQLITFVEYLERLPQGSVTNKSQLIDAKKKQMQQQQQMQADQMQQQQDMQNQAQSDQQNQQAQIQGQQNQDAQAKNAEYEKLAQFMESLPKETQDKLNSLPGDQMESQLIQLMKQSVSQSMKPPTK